ncbi:PP2C family protein-serine/threonine phosphatase, partial [Bacteroidota bacterium]
NAIRYLEELRTYNDSIFNKDKHEQIAEIQEKYESERKQRDIELLDKENQIKELRVKRQGLIIFLSFIGLFILTILIVFYIRQNSKVKLINVSLESEKQKITDSIEYAEKIQAAILPPKKYIDRILTDYFIYYKPCSTISGDFYWIDKKKGKIIVAAADCTGHGVPGGLLSTLGISILKESISNATELDPKVILDNLNFGLNAALHQTALNSPHPNDGMEIGLLIIDLEKMIIQFSGAKSIFYLVRNREISEVYGNKRAIGYQKRAKAFVNNILKIEPGDNLYLFTDGIVHQIGGEKGNLFSLTRLKKMLVEISGLSPFAQKFQIEKKMDAWMEMYQQLDDMLLIGIKV